MKTTDLNKIRRIAIIGSGPRGMSVLERLVARINEASNKNDIEIYLIDDGYVGFGRVWATDQSPNLLMNTVAQEVSAFSGLWDGKEPKPGNGPSFGQWWKLNFDDYEKYGGYGPRAYYGKYLLYVLSVIEKSLSNPDILHKISGYVTGMDIEGEKQVLTFADGNIITVDRTVIATGHSVNNLTGVSKKLKDFADSNSDIKFIPGSYSVASLDLTSIKSKENVGVIGMGLTFYDLLGEFTIGRGGKFTENKDGTLVYTPSGQEPHLFVGSRSGMPMPARGKNQKPFNYEYNPAIYTIERVLEIRRKGNVHFERDLLPLIEAEVALVYAETKLRIESGTNLSEKLRSQVIKKHVNSVEGVRMLAEALGISCWDYVDLYKLKNPFYGCCFNSINEFNEKLADLLLQDYKEAMNGNLDSPLKASLDVLRNIRPAIRAAVDFGGLNPKSHKEEFLEKFAPATNFLAAGPPAFRIAQLRALILAGVVTVVGPSTIYEVSKKDGCINITSPQVCEFNISVKMVIDARLPDPNLREDCSEFTQYLLKNGIYTPFINKEQDLVFETCGVNVTEIPYHPIGKNKSILENVYVLGIPTEYTRWFMQSGSTRPDHWIDFMIDADAIAEAALASVVGGI